MKKFFLFILLTLLPILASAEIVEIDGIWYNLVTKLKEAEVSSNPNFVNTIGSYSGSIEIPTSVTYNDIIYSVTSIGEDAFSNSSLTSITIPNSVISIGKWAFSGCSTLPSVTIPNSVTSIGGFAFSGCKALPSVTIPNSVTSIGGGAFERCSGLISITIPSSVTSIGNFTFRECTALTSITIGNSVSSIGKSVFEGCRSLISITIPNSVTSIGNSAFKDCRGLTSVTIGNGVTSIDEDAFSGCKSLNSVHISDIGTWCKLSFKKKESNPLYYAHHLYLDGEEIKELVIPNSVTTIGEKAFYECYELTSITIPNSVTTICDHAFYGCNGLTSVIIPNSVLYLSGFTYCSGLTSVTIPNSVISINNAAFRGCNSLTSVNIPNSVTSIGKLAFENCSGLTSVNIGSGLKSIGEQAFANCEYLTDVYCWAEKISKNESWIYEALYTYPDAFLNSYPQGIILHVPAASIEAYRSTEPWSQFKAIETLDDGDIPETKKCATPEISYSNGKLDFTCETEGVEFVSEVIVEDAKKYYDASVTLSQTYNVTVYATKAGYENSDVATASLCWIGVEPKTEGIINNIASVRALAVLIQSNGNQLTVSGADEGTVIYVYDTSGNQVGSSKVSAGTTTIKTSLRSGEIGIVKIGDRSVKVLMK